MEIQSLIVKASFTLLTTFGLIGCAEIGQEQLDPKVVDGCFVNNNQSVSLTNGFMITHKDRPPYKYSVTPGKNTSYTLLVTPCPMLKAGKVGIDERLESCFVFGEHNPIETLNLIDNKGVNYRFAKADAAECYTSG